MAIWLNGLGQRASCVDEPKPTLETALTSALDLACLQGDAAIAARLFMTLARFLARDPWTWHVKPDH